MFVQNERLAKFLVLTYNVSKKSILYNKFIRDIFLVFNNPQMVMSLLHGLVIFSQLAVNMLSPALITERDRGRPK